MILALSSAGWQKFQDMRALTSRIKKAEQETILLREECERLSKYKEEIGLSLSKFYLKIFNDIREACIYYGAPCEIKIIGAKDFVDTQDYFKPSEYRGIKSVDALCQITLSNVSNADLTGIIYKIIKFNPVEVLEAKIEKNTLSLILRLYGI